jgi:hypothetical protein
MLMIPVMMTWANAYSSIWRKENPLPLEAYRLNFGMMIGMKQVDSRFCRGEGIEGVFESPLVRVDFPAGDGEGDCISIYVSGVVEELETRIRQASGK